MSQIRDDWLKAETTPIDFIVVGAGAGGAPLAARLAERGFQVLVLEMGPDKPKPLPGSLVENTEVPLLNSETTEDERHSLRFFVDHFRLEEANNRNPRRHHPDEDSPALHPEDEKGIFYPRAQGIGGCTIHNAMITICGPSEDWDEIAEVTGDPSWRGERMRAYFERLEKCHYDRPRSVLHRIRGWFGFATGWENARHGHQGWLQTCMADLRLLFNEKKFLKVVLGAAQVSLHSGIEFLSELKGKAFPQLDPNHWDTMRKSQEGLAQIPLAITEDGARSSPRERLNYVRAHYPENLHVVTGVVVTEVEIENNQAVGVNVLEQEHVYEADAKAQRPPEDWQSHVKTLRCRREIILCGGSFNTPQLLMLSGIGDQAKMGQVPVKHELPGVGGNLQDRYEVPVIATIQDRFRSLDSVGLTSQVAADADPVLNEWRNRRGVPSGTNVYATNGGLIGVFMRSRVEQRVPDLFMFALAGYFRGYEVGWSKPSSLAPDADAIEESRLPKHGSAAATDKKRILTWLVLKARTRHHGGTVSLRSDSPFRRPKVNFNSFPTCEEDGVNGELDVEALSEGVNFVERVLKNGKKNGLIESYHRPAFEKFEDLNDWIRNSAWGHHACGTCKIGPDGDSHAVLDSRFRVRGIKGLRVVDASVFPRIPGYFIVTNVYMISEKAADVISEDHGDHIASVSKKFEFNLEQNPIFYSNREAQQRETYPVEMEHAEAQLIKARRGMRL